MSKHSADHDQRTHVLETICSKAEEFTCPVLNTHPDLASCKLADLV